MDALKPGKLDQAVPLAGMIAILAGTMGLFFWVKPLQTFRPAVQEERHPPLEVRLPARLWQDPIEQARESVDRTQSGTPQGQVDCILNLTNTTRILAVTVYGGYSQLDHETRLRTRYAVELALNDNGYVPYSEDTEFLRFLAVDWKDQSGNVSRKVVPFELWLDEHLVLNPQQILVLWIDDTLVETNLQDNLKKLTRTAGIPECIREELRLIGPTSSSGLKELINENDQWPKYIHSPWATADEVFLFGDEVSPECMQLPSKIDRTIATDRLACGRLIEELGKRNIRLRGTQGHDCYDSIAVLSEWDTVYGRSLPVTFAACVLEPEGCRDYSSNINASITRFRNKVRELLGPEESCRWPKEIRPVVYLRGLDGIGPRSPEQSQGPNKRDEPSHTDMERSDGTSQLDYARRLANRLRVQSTSLRAVGVLGGDIYDKLLLLQALREILPDVLFFTTDLDAGYLHPSQNEWSRNLLVASGFGLYERGLQRSESRISPPFRDTYGVAIHRAVTHAIISDKQRPAKETSYPEVKIYEIGRTAPQRLTSNNRDQIQDQDEECPRQAWTLDTYLWWVLVIVLAGVLLLMHGGWSGLRMWLAAILLFSAILVVGIAGTREEPFQWLEGISIWPTEIIRLIATVAAFVLLFRADRALRDNFKGLTTASHFNALPPKRNAGKWIWAQAWQKLLIEAPKPDSKGRVEAQSIWHHYEQSDECAVRWWRTVPLAGIVLVVTAYILKSERPILPCRGTISCGTDLVVAAVSFFILLLLTFYIADATATCNRWIRCLISVQTIWPGGEGTCSAVADDWGAPSKDLPGAWHEVEIVARRTQVVGQLILYPFSILLVLILSRSRVFDHWPWSGSLVIMFSFPLGLALISALLLRSSAEELRTKSGVEVRSLWVEAIRAEDRSKTELAETAMKSIEGESRGGFSPFTQNPVLAAILLPLTGAGTGLAIEKLIGKF